MAQVIISVDRAQAYGESTSVRATNVTAIADTGAQVIVRVWSLDEFVKYGFSRDIRHPTWWPPIIPPYQLQGRSSPSLKDCRVTVMLCNAGPWSTLAPTFKLAMLEVLFPSFPSLGKHASAEMQECAGEPAAINITHLTRIVTGGCASLGDQNHSCICPQGTAIPPPLRSLPFCCIPENNDRMKT